MSNKHDKLHAEHRQQKYGETCCRGSIQLDQAREAQGINRSSVPMYVANEICKGSACNGQVGKRNRMLCLKMESDDVEGHQHATPSNAASGSDKKRDTCNQPCEHVSCADGQQRFVCWSLRTKGFEALVCSLVVSSAHEQAILARTRVERSACAGLESDIIVVL
jgi:hypothetical protein